METKKSIGISGCRTGVTATAGAFQQWHNRILQSGSHKSNPLTVSAYYNHATGEIVIIPNQSIESPFCITLLNSLGQTIQTKNYKGYGEKIILPIQKIPNGIYLINLTTANQENTSTKLLINN